MKNSGFCGLDIGGTYTKAVVTTADGEILLRRKRETRGDLGPEVALSEIEAWVGELIEETLSVSVKGLGIGICGPTDFANGTLLTSPILIGWHGIPVKSRFSASLKLPVFVDNDANLAVLGETWIGAAQGKENVAGFTLGTGVGGGVVLRGELIRGSHSFGGELGHMTAVNAGRHCDCGNCGCLTAEASSQALMDRYQQHAIESNGFTSQHIFDLAARQDPVALSAIEPMLEALAIGIANVLNIFDPDCVILAGGPTNTGEWFLEQLVKRVGTKVFPELFAHSTVLYAKLGEWAGAVGGAKLAADLIEHHQTSEVVERNC